MKHVEKYISRKAQKNAIKNMYVLQMLKTKVVLIAIKMQKKCNFNIVLECTDNHNF